MSVIENLDVVMGAQTAELDAAVAKEIKNLDNLKKAASGGASLDVKGFKDMGKLTKSTAEFGGVLGNLAGDSTIGQLGQMIGGISEKVSQFSEISQAGGAGALLFKAGLVGLVAAGSFNIGTMIGEWWFETKKWNDMLKESADRLKYLGDATRALQQARFKDEMKDLQLLDPSARQDEISKMFNQSNRDLEGLTLRRDAAAPGAEKNDLEAQLNALRQRRAILWEEIDPRNQQLRLMEEAKQKEQEQAAIRQAANEQLSQLRKRYDELTLGKDKAREAEMRELGLSEGAIGREMTMRKLVEEQEKAAEKLKKEQEEIKRIEQEQLEIRKQATGVMEDLARRYTELTQGKDEARRQEMLGMGLSETDVAMEQQMRKMVEEREKSAEKLKNDEAEAKRIKEDSLSADEKLAKRATELQALKDQGMITEAEFQKQLRKAEESTRENKPEYKGAVSAQSGSVEAYKMLLERERGAINEAIKQTAIQQRMAIAMEEAAKQLKRVRTIGAAR